MYNHVGGQTISPFREIRQVLKNVVHPQPRSYAGNAGFRCRSNRLIPAYIWFHRQHAHIARLKASPHPAAAKDCRPVKASFDAPKKIADRYADKNREEQRKKARDQRRAREQRLQEWGHHNAKPEVAAAEVGIEVVAAGAADAVLIGS